MSGNENKPSLLPIEEANERLAAVLTPPATTHSVPLMQCLGRVCAHDIHAPADVPAFNASAMDGYAARGVDFTGGQELKLVGESFAGHPFTGQVAQGCAIRIFTGAVLPDELDTVAIQEDITLSNDVVRANPAPSPGANVRLAGNDIKQGAKLIQTGKRLNAFDIGMARSCGLTELRVYKPVRVAMFSTGDELRTPPDALAVGEIYDANRLMIELLLKDSSIEFTDAGALPDEPNAIEATLRDLSSRHDVIVTSGGVSVGDADYVREAFETIGTLSFYKLNLKPGKPLAVGRIDNPDGSVTEFFGLPGNPVSTIVTALLILMPSLEHLCGANPVSPILPHYARVIERFGHRPGREEYQRGVLNMSESGDLVVSPSGDQGSNRIMSFVDANSLVRIPAEHGALEVGDVAQVFDLASLLNRLS